MKLHPDSLPQKPEDIRAHLNLASISFVIVTESLNVNRLSAESMDTTRERLQELEERFADLRKALAAAEKRQVQ